MSDEQKKRKRTTYLTFRRIGDALVNPEVSVSQRLDLIFGLLDGCRAFGSARYADSAWESLKLVKKDLGIEDENEELPAVA